MTQKCVNVTQICVENVMKNRNLSENNAKMRSCEIRSKKVTKMKQKSILNNHFFQKIKKQQ